MTNTLHRCGAPETLKGDYIVFAMQAKGINDEGAPAKLREFLRLAIPHSPINLGDGMKGGIYRPSSNLNPLTHWRERETIPPEKIADEVDCYTVVGAVFDRKENMEAFLKDLRKADLGMSINISALMDDARECAERAGLTRHSVEYSLGFDGDLNLLPNRHVLELSTMCGHGMISHNLAKKMIDLVKEGRRTTKEAAACLARFCVCGVFNTLRAEQILEAARKSNP